MKNYIKLKIKREPTKMKYLITSKKNILDPIGAWAPWASTRVHPCYVLKNLSLLAICDKTKLQKKKRPITNIAQFNLQIKYQPKKSDLRSCKKRLKVFIKMYMYVFHEILKRVNQRIGGKQDK